MAPSSRSYLLTDLSWVDVRAHLESDRRLIVPIGVCDQYGPHLPIGSGTLVAEAIARELSQDFGVIRAPTFPHGVTLPSERRYAGTAGLREKTLHQVLNDLLASWEDHGFCEFILVTAQRYEPHVEAVATVTGTTARVRVIDVLGIDLSAFLESPSGPQHGGEALTSLMLYLYPDKVNLERVDDHPPHGGEENGRRRLSRLAAKSPGSVGEPSLASAEKGRRIYQHVVQRIRSRVFLDPQEEWDE